MRPLDNMRAVAARRRYWCGGGALAELGRISTALLCVQNIKMNIWCTVFRGFLASDANKRVS